MFNLLFIFFVKKFQRWKNGNKVVQGIKYGLLFDWQYKHNCLQYSLEYIKSRILC